MQNLSSAAVMIEALWVNLFVCLIGLFDLILYIPVNNFTGRQDRVSWVEQVLSVIKSCLRTQVECSAAGDLKPATP